MYHLCEKSDYLWMF